MSSPHHILVVDDESDLELLVRQRFRRQIRDKEFEFHFSRNVKKPSMPSPPGPISISS